MPSVPLNSEEAAGRAAQVPEKFPCRCTLHFLSYERCGQNTVGQAAHHILVERIRLQEVLLGVLAESELSVVHREGNGVGLDDAFLESSKYQDFVGFLWTVV